MPWKEGRKEIREKRRKQRKKGTKKGSQVSQRRKEERRGVSQGRKTDIVGEKQKGRGGTEEAKEEKHSTKEEV